LLPARVEIVMLAAPAAMATVLALLGSSPGAPSTLEQLSAASLQATGRSARLPDASLGLAWARRGTALALVAKPVASGQPIRIVDTRDLRTRHVIAVGDRDVCGLTFDGADLVALAADRPCYWSGGHFVVLRVAAGASRITSVVPVPALGSVLPPNLAFGDGKAFVARAGGGIDAVDLTSGATVSHRPSRALAKGEGIVPARWLGAHTLGAGALAVDVRSWRGRSLGVGTRGLAEAGDDLVAYGSRGVSVYTRTGRLKFHADAGVAVDDVHVLGPLLYASAGAAVDVVDLRTQRLARTVVAPAVVWTLLAP
jgi:hypothetical protein